MASKFGFICQSLAMKFVLRFADDSVLIFYLKTKIINDRRFLVLKGQNLTLGIISMIVG